MVEFLLRHGAQPVLADDPPWATPRAWAEKRGHEPIIRLLNEFERSGGLPTQPLQRYEALALDLVEAYGPGNPAALQRIVEYFRAERAVAWDRPPHEVRVSRVRKAMQERLRDCSASKTTDTALAPDDARWLIARAEGFERWEDLRANLGG
jgi:hypothetical protein